MKFSEVMHRFRFFDHERSQRQWYDPIVSIVLDKPSVGPRAMTGIKHIGQGFDWENGHILISPEVSLVPKTKDEKIWEMAREHLMWVATKPAKRVSYEVSEARRILDRAGIEYMKYQRMLHRELEGKP